MGTKARLVGTEVPILGSDSVNWIELTVPATSLSDAPPAAAPVRESIAPPTEDRASCSAIGDPSHYFFWRINKSLPRVLELLEFSVEKEFPRNGLRIWFPEALSPFAFICLNQFNRQQGNPYLLYALTMSGVAYLLYIKNLDSYVSSSSSILPENAITQLDLPAYLSHGMISSVAAAAGFFLVGTNSGSVICFKLGSVHPTCPGFHLELRDDTGIGRLWGLVSRGKMVGAVQDLVIAEMLDVRLLAFALHADGTLRVWDLRSCSRILNHGINPLSSTGMLFKRLWIDKANSATDMIPMMILHKQNLEDIMETISVYEIHCVFGDKLYLSVNGPVQSIPLEGGCVDAQFSEHNILILKDNGLSSYSMLRTNSDVEEPQCYALQEEFIADQLYQSSEHFPDDLLWITQLMFSPVKDQIIAFVSSIFLRKLLHPGIFHDGVFQMTMLDYNKHLTSSELRSLTVDGIKKEILTLIEHEVNKSPLSAFYHWKALCNCYFDHWCKNNAPLGLFVQSPCDAIVLIRRSSVSSFRLMEKIELLVAGYDEVNEVINPGLISYEDKTGREILSEVLGCINCISQQLGKTAPDVIYELLMTSPMMSSDDFLPCFLKILTSGYSSLLDDSRTDITLQKKSVDHKKLRKFSVNMFLSLHNISSKAASWRRVLEVIESYINFIVPQKAVHKFESERSLDMTASMLVQSTSQISRVMFESAIDILLFLRYLLHVSGKIHMPDDDVCRIQFELVPLLQDVISEWHIIHFCASMPSEAPTFEDFSYQLSSLKIDSNIHKCSWKDRLGKRDFTLGSLLLSNGLNSFENHGELGSKYLPGPQVILSAVRNFISWIISGRTGEESSVFISHATELAMILIRDGQYNAAELLIGLVVSHAQKECNSRSLQDAKGEWCFLHHLLGCSLLAQARGLHGTVKETKVNDAVRCFFRVSSGEGASQALKNLSQETGFPQLGLSNDNSPAAWKLQYYQWVMQTFEQHNISEGACQFALAALEQVDEALSGMHSANESATTIRGRIWANVFKFNLDLNRYNDAYCAIISNPDEESKVICLRRFIIVLYEHGAYKILCNGQLPFIGLTEKVELELSWKAERSDIMLKKNPYKLLYAFEMHRQNWRKAAGYIYRYTYRLRNEAAVKDGQRASVAIQERLDGLSGAINALHLVDPRHAWIDPLLEEIPTKKAKTTAAEQRDAIHHHEYLGIEQLENEFVLTSAENLLCLANIKWSYSNASKLPSDLVDLLVEIDMYDITFTVLLKFCKDTGLKRELERVFRAMALKCCPNTTGSTLNGKDLRTQPLLLTSSANESFRPSLLEGVSPMNQLKGKGNWENLEFYLGKYKTLHARLPVIVGETLLHTDSEIELPLWLVHMFKHGGGERRWGMTGQESSPASLFQLYVNYGRFAEATNLLLEYLDSYKSVRPAEVIFRKRPSAVWFPYTAIERLWCQLGRSIALGHKVDQSKKLQSLLHGALSEHFKLLKLDSEDAIASLRSKLDKA